MNNPMNVIFVLLVATAVILGAILINSYTTPAYADPGVNGGGYVMGAVWVNQTHQAIYIIDMSANTLNAFGLGNNNVITPMFAKPMKLQTLFPTGDKQP